MITDDSFFVSSGPQSGKGVHSAPWEKAFMRVLSPFEAFINKETTTGLLLLGITVVALVLANSPLAELYHEVGEMLVGVSIGDWELQLTVHHWVNDALMALFFFVVGLELKHEILVGDLAQPRQAILPIAAAIGGMVVPALCYVAFNLDGPGADGWGVPMATDIAFAVGVLALLGKRIPTGLATFLVALAIVDDLGAVLVIALFYTRDIQELWLLGAAGIVGLMVTLNLMGVRRAIPYFLLAVCLWYALLLAGVHATLAGVLGAATVPARPRYDPMLFSRHMKKLLETFDRNCSADSSCSVDGTIMRNDELLAVVQTFENGIHSVQPPLLRLERIWHVPVAYLVIPVFAFFNAGIPVNVTTLSQALVDPVAIGIASGLLFGKVVGISFAAWLMLRLGIARLPTGARFSQVVGVAFLAGIGFTMAIFIAELAFAMDAQSLLMAKMSILFSSLLAGIIGYIWLRLCSPPATAQV